MTSLLPPSTTSGTSGSSASSRGGRAGSALRRTTDDLRHRRPLVLVATLGGVAAACATLLVALAIGVIGWFLTDAGAHGTPRDGLRAGALGWLLAHGSGLRVEGALVTIVPLGVTAVAAWVIWRVGHRVGDAVSGHGPDSDRISDGERDWTVQQASLLFSLGYAAVGVVTVALAGTPQTDPSTARVIGWSVLLCTVFGATAIAVGAGRAPIWATLVPPSVRAVARTCRNVLVAWLLVSTVLFVGSLVADFDTAVNVMSQLHTDVGDATLFTALSATLAPNAAIFSGSYLLGPGFSVGAGTLVSPAVVVLGPLPMFPLLAALPDAGPTSSWTAWLVMVPVLVAAVAAALAHRRMPTLRWEEGALRGVVGGVLAGVVFAGLCVLSGGAVGPGRMRDVAPESFQVLVHAITSFGIGGLVGGLVMTWWVRRGARRMPDAG